jgi:hypothetical protein
VREPFSLPLAAKVESANATRAEVIGSIDLVRANDCLFPRGRVFLNLCFADFITHPVCMTLLYTMSDISLKRRANRNEEKNGEHDSQASFGRKEEKEKF